MSLKPLCALFFINCASNSHAVSSCDQLAALAADPLSTSVAVKFVDLNAKHVIAKCTEAIRTSGNKVEEARFTLQRARGFFRAGEGDAAIDDLSTSYALGYPAASFALATAFFLGEDVEMDLLRAEILFLESYRKGVIWSARGLALLYGDIGSELYNPEKSILWEKKFNEENN